MKFFRVFLLSTAGVLGACASFEDEPLPLQLAQPVVYRQQVQPYVARRCGSLDCHGNPGRLLRIYSRHSLRAPGTPRSSGMTQREYQENLQSFAAMDRPEAGEGFILKKGLSIDAGGLAHVGGDVWTSVEEPGYRCIDAWLKGSQDPKACQSAVALVDPDDDDDDDDD